MSDNNSEAITKKLDNYMFNGYRRYNYYKGNECIGVTEYNKNKCLIHYICFVELNNMDSYRKKVLEDVYKDMKDCGCHDMTIRTFGHDEFWSSIKIDGKKFVRMDNYENFAKEYRINIIKPYTFIDRLENLIESEKLLDLI